MRADSFFTNLTKRQSMLLLTAVTFGGAEGAQAFEHLPEEEAEILQERAARLMEVPRERRIPFLVQEIKRLVMGRKGGDLRGADPQQVARALRGERPALAEVILRALPAQLAEPVRNELPPSAVRLTREVRPEILQVIRWHFERQLGKAAPRQASFLFPDLLSLSAKDLLTLADHLGADELAPALAGVGASRRDEVIKALSAEQRALALKALASGKLRKLDEKQADALLQDLAGDDPRHTVRRAGLRRVVRACMGESTEFASKLAEKHHDALGRMLIQSIRAERVNGRPRDGQRQKVEVVARLEHLAERGLVERPVRLAPPPPALRDRIAPKSAAPVRISSRERIPIPAPRQPAPARERERPAEPPRLSPSGNRPASPPKLAPSSERSPRSHARTEIPAIQLPTAPGRPAQRSTIMRDPQGSSVHRAPERDPSGSAIHRVPGQNVSTGRARVVRGEAASHARPTRPRRPGDR